MITLEGLSLQRGSLSLLQNTSLIIHRGQRIGVVGSNGAGKSSLFKLLLGELHQDAGELLIPAQLRIAHMAQEVHTRDKSALDYVLDGDKPLRKVQIELAEAEAKEDNHAIARLHAELENLDGYTAPNRAEQLLLGLGFTMEQTQQPVQSFSGGWRIRLNLAQALLMPSELLLLDEPTNHLDLDATLWLENWLRQYPGTLLLISHDRDFLDSVVEHIAHFEQQKINLYRGNYSAFEMMRAQRLAQQQAQFEKQQTRIAEIENFVRRFKAKASKAKQAQSRVKELERMEKIAPAHVDSPFQFTIPCTEKTSSPLLVMDGANVGYGDKAVLSDVNFSLLPGMRIGLLGPNGAGKSTLIKTLVGDLPVVSGVYTAGENLQVGYFAQHQLESLDLNASALLHIQRLSPKVSEQEIRNYLGGFGFRGDDVETNVNRFSGGEKARLALSVIAWQKPNLLLLDEPTNHLDLEMRLALTFALQSFPGVVILVSHDRHMLRNTVDEFWLVCDGKVEPFDGDLEDYHVWLKNRSQGLKKAADASAPANEDDRKEDKRDRKEERRLAAQRREQLRPMKKKVDKLETDLDKVQAELAKIEQELAEPEIYQDENKDRLQVLLKKQGELSTSSETIEEEWMTLQEELEEAQAELENEKA
ncbi:ATP-binding cassette domain-containing protein [Oceanospirillum maris]|uniref:ATP-binding cassette domain-containing protein n=1 Tax=Oceanospirillum maris TaxID=64977 RepID=UPI0003FCCBE8|nr:ATP-binding cassette domain-containing protein [Oceanospirillum maris]